MTDDKLADQDPGPRDRGGEGGMASREYDARHRDPEQPDSAEQPDEAETDLADLDLPTIGRGIESGPDADV